MGRCEKCSQNVSVRLDRGQGIIEGLAVIYHCDGNPLTFEEAEAMFEDSQGLRSILLREDTRLVRLDEDRFGIQFKNTYVVRICQNGCYVLNSSRRMNEDVAKVIADYTPVEVKIIDCEWKYAHNFVKFNDLDVVDSVGDLLPRFKTPNREI
jgi:hypothetical protein